MASDTAQRIRDIFEAVVSSPAAGRASVIDKLCGSDTSLRSEIESLLEHDTEVPDDFMRPQVQRSDAIAETPQIDRRVGTTIGQFEIQDVIASGGMGTVYLAKQLAPKRDVALKIISPAAVTRLSLRRFENEARLLGRLEHPHIAQVYDAGSFADPSLGGTRIPYFAMQHVKDARTLLKYAAEHKLNLEARLRLFIQVCEGIHHGHQRGIIHRDIKPNNILVDSSGSVKVIDFGVARSINSDVTLATMQTDTGMLIGTLQYMSPEQCTGDADDLDIRTDIYSLGVVLYELLTDRRPYNTSGTTLIEATRIIRESSPCRPSQMNAQLRGDLETIILKALEKDRNRRYSSAQELGADVRKYLKHQPISARRPSNAYLIGKFVQRNRWQTIAGVATVLTVLSLAVGSFVWNSYQRESLERGIAAANAYGAQINAAHVAIQAAEIGAARTILDRLDEAHRGWEWRFLQGQLDQSFETLFDSRVSRGAQPGALAEANRQPTRIHGVAISRDKSRIAVSTDYPPRVTILRRDGSVECPDVPMADGAEPNVRYSIALSHDGRLLSTCTRFPGKRADTGDDTFALEIWDLCTPNKPQLLANISDQQSVVAAFHPDKYILAANLEMDEEILNLRLWDLEPLLSKSPDMKTKLQPLAAWQTHATYLQDLCFSEDGTMLASASNDYTARIWDARIPDQSQGDWEDAHNRQLAVLRGHEFHVNSVAFSPDGCRLASASVDGTAILWDVAASISEAKQATIKPDPQVLPGVQLARLVGHNGDLIDAVFNTSGDRVITSGHDRTIRVWDLNEHARVSDANRTQDWKSPRPRLVNTLYGHEEQVCRLEMLNDGRLLSVSNDGSLKLWDLDVVDIPRLIGHGTSVQRVEVTPDDRFFISVGNSESIIVWSADSLLPTDVRFLEYAAGPMDTECWIRDGQTFLATCGGQSEYEYSGRLRVWTISDDGKLSLHRQLSSVSIHNEVFRSVAVSFDGKRLAAGDAFGKVRVWDLDDLESIQPIASFDVGDGSVGELAFLDQAGDWIVVGNGPKDWSRNVGLLQLWQVETNGDSPSQDCGGIQSVVSALAIDLQTSVNGRVQRLATGSIDQSIVLWNVAWDGDAPRLVQSATLNGHTGQIFALAFHPTEPRLISGSADRMLKLWNLETQTEAASFRDHAGSVNAIAVNSTGDTFLTASMGIQGSDNVARVWYAPPTSQPRSITKANQRKQAANLRAHELVYHLGRSAVPSIREMRRRIAEELPLPANVKQIALENFDNLLPQPSYMAQHAKNILENPNATRRDLEDAMEWIRAAKRIDPVNAQHDEVLEAIRARAKTK